MSTSQPHLAELHLIEHGNAEEMLETAAEVEARNLSVAIKAVEVAQNALWRAVTARLETYPVEERQDMLVEYVLDLGRAQSGAENGKPKVIEVPQYTGELTRREREVLEATAEGLSNAQLARRFWLTEQTIKFHLSNVYRKLNVSNRTEASAWLHALSASSNNGDPKMHQPKETLIDDIASEEDDPLRPMGKVAILLAGAKVRLVNRQAEISPLEPQGSI